MKPPQLIETERLVLRIPSLADAEAIFNSYAQDHNVLRYLTWLPHENIQETEGFLADCIAAWKNASRFPYVIVLRERVTRS